MVFNPTAHVIIVTDYDAEDLKIEAFAAGAAGYVLKDDLAELEALVTRLR